MARGRRRAGRGEPSAPVTTTLGPQRRASRAQQRHRRRKQRRQATVAAFVAAALLVVAVAGLAIRRFVTEDETPPPPKQRTQRTMLFAVTGSNGGARAAALLAHDPTPGRASVVLIPPRTLADVAGIGNVVLADAVRLGGATAAQETVSDLMGVVVDHHWVLRAETFAALVDRLGGVLVDVDVDVVATGADAGTIVVRAGPQQRLDGATALTFATYVQRGQDEIAFQARFQKVIEAVLAALPPDRAALATTLSALGPGSRLTWQPDELAGYLGGLRDAVAANRYEPQVLPVTPIDAGGSSVSYGIRVDEVATLVRNQLADSVPPNRATGTNRVLILNGVGTPGLGGEIARKLRGEFSVVGTRNKQGFGVTESVVVVFDPAEPSVEKGRRVATLLGLRPESVRIGTQAQSVADVIVVIGSDYKP